MRNFVLLITILSVFLSTSAKQITINKSLNPKNDVSLISDSGNELIFQVQVNQFSLKDIDIDGETHQIISANNLSEQMLEGTPDVPKMAFSVQIPNTLWLNRYEVMESSFIEYENINLAPSRGVIYRNENPSEIAYEKGISYSRDEFFPHNLVKIGEPYIVRDFRGESIQVYPIQYNPVSKTLRVYTSLKIKAFSNREIGINPILATNGSSKIDAEFDKLYQKLFINYNSNNRYTVLPDQGNLLIISHSNFTDEIKDFANWKRQRGIPTELVELSTTGSSATEIESYIENYYNTNGLTYVLLIGDNTHIPSLSSNGDSDQAYGQISGNDHYPEIIIGRFSVETVGDAAIMVQKAIWYEKDVSTSDSWLESATGIASNEGGSSSDDGESDDEHMDNIRTKLLGYGYTNVDQAYQDNNITSTELAAFINEGRGLINYVGHGDNTLWVTSGFNNDDVDNLTNENKLPFIFDVACVNGNFHGQTCFAEAWTRANNNGKLTGAVAIVASTINQPWSPPMDGQDEMVDILIESYTNNIKRTFGGISYNGVMHMLDEYPDQSGQETADTWTIFGDPALHVRTKTPMVLNVNHANSFTLGQTSFTVTSSVEGALIALSKLDGNDDVVLLGTGLIAGGSATINIPAFTNPGEMVVTATGYNYIPAISNVQVIASSGPYLIYNNSSINDVAGNNNSLADFDESILLNLAIENVGPANSNNANVTLSTSSNFAELTDETEAYGAVASGEIKNIDNAFGITITNDVPDQEIIHFDVEITDDAGSYASSFSIVANAPQLELELVGLSDANGNNNGVMDPGEFITISVKAKNTGHASTEPSEINASETSSYFTLDDTSVDSGPLYALNGQYTAQFTGIVSSQVPDGESVAFTFTLNSNNYSANLEVSLPIGISLEDWESETFDTYDWSNTSSTPWSIVSDVVYAGNYSSKSGSIGNSQTSILSIEMEVTSNDSISFYKKVSCEDCTWDGYWWDFLQFDINGNETGKWDGEVDWSREAYPVSAGNVTLQWTYSKDNIEIGGSDCAWLDNIILPPHTISTTILYQSIEQSVEFKVYPVPARDNIHIDYSIEKAEEVQINIVDLSGKLIKTVVNQEQAKGVYALQVNGLELNSGMYFVNFVTEKETFVKKLLIE